MRSPYCSDDVFRVNGEEVHNLTLLGKIVKANDSSTSLVYTIDDGTGTVEVKMWVDAEVGLLHRVVAPLPGVTLLMTWNILACHQFDVFLTVLTTRVVTPGCHSIGYVDLLEYWLS
jgi:hypothetical protein